MGSINRFLLLILLINVYSASAFFVKDIRVEGLQRVSIGTFYNAFPIKENDDVDQEIISEATRSLFKTGYFEDIQIARDKDVLIVKVIERPTVSEINITGNKNISTKTLKKGLVHAGLEEGNLYKPEVLVEMRHILRQQYAVHGRYNADIVMKVTPQPRNRVHIDIKIHEGKAAKIKHINVVGNHAFNEKKLLENFKLQKSNIFSFLSDNDRYSKEKLSGDLERLRYFYMDQGYLNFQILSTQVAITPDKKDIYITVNIQEGKIFKINNIVLSGQLIYPYEEMESLVTINKGDVFSQKNLMRVVENITNKLGEKGYIFSSVEPVYKIDEKQGTVNIDFKVKSGQSYYVRYINFHGNVMTRDYVLRRAMRQFEGAPANSKDIRASTDQLNRLTFFKDVKVNKTPVSDSGNEIDLDYKVEEQHSGSITFNAGYSQLDGLLLGGAINQSNFLGSGKAIGFNAQTSRYTKDYSFYYNDPYYTLSGISRGFTLYYNATNYKKVDITNYNLERIGGNLAYGFPLSDTSRFYVTFSYDHTKLKLGVNPAYFIQDYFKQYGQKYKSLLTTVGWGKSKFNYGLLPTKGYGHNVSVAFSLPGVSTHKFYKLSYKTSYLYPFNDLFSFQARASLGYGGSFNSSGLPFYENYFGGGLGSIRGFDYGALGPQALQTNGKTEPIGGNVSFDGTLGVVFPLPFIKDKRSSQGSVFLDFGNVWSTTCSNATVPDGEPNAGEKYIQYCNRPSLGDMRYSVGVGLTWITGLGPLTFSVAKTLNRRKHEKGQVFQFAIGNTF